MMGKMLFSIFVILLGAGLAGAAALNVGPEKTFIKIQSAIDAANTGDVIYVSEGTYNENPVIKKNGISIIGNNKEQTIIDGQKTGSTIRIEANNVIISGFTVRNNGGSGKDDAGVSLYGANNNIIANSIITDNTVGIAIYSSSNSNTISGNEIKSNGRYGIFIYSSNDNKIINNDIQKNQIGIYADSARTSRFYSNNLLDNKDQAYDNSGQNSWDDDKSGNYWNTYKGSGAYNLLGGAGAKDNYPLSSAVTIRYMPISTEQKPQERKVLEETGKSSPGFIGSMVLISLILIVVLRAIKKE